MTRATVDAGAVEAVLARWVAGELGAAEVQAWAGSVVGADASVREVLAELDLLAVFLLTPEDVPALRALLAAPDPAAGLDAWTRYRDAIDLDERSRRLKRDKFYKPFCR